MTQPVRQAMRVFKRDGGQANRKLLVAQPADRVDPARILAETSGDIEQHGISRLMPKLIVDIPEAVDIDASQAKRSSRIDALGLDAEFDLRLQDAKECLAI